MTTKDKARIKETSNLHTPGLKTERQMSSFSEHAQVCSLGHFEASENAESFIKVSLLRINTAKTGKATALFRMNPPTTDALEAHLLMKSRHSLDIEERHRTGINDNHQ